MFDNEAELLAEKENADAAARLAALAAKDLEERAAAEAAAKALAEGGPEREAAAKARAMKSAEYKLFEGLLPRLRYEMENGIGAMEYKKEGFTPTLPLPPVAEIAWTYEHMVSDGSAWANFPKGVPYAVARYKLMLDGVNVGNWLNVREMESRSGNGFYFHSKPTGKHHLSIGYGSNKEKFRELKDGTWKYDEIAHALVRKLTSERVAARLATVAKRNAETIPALKKELGLRTYSSVVEASADKVKPVMVTVNVRKAMTADGAKTLIAGLRKLGVKVDYSDIENEDGTYSGKFEGEV